MAKLNNINQIRRVEWSRSYLWDIYIAEATSSTTALGSAIQTAKQFGKDLASSFLGATDIGIPKDGKNPQWFPITQFDLVSESTVTQAFPLTYRTKSMPIGTKEKTISLTFVDDMNHTMYDWAKDWFNPFTRTSDGEADCVKTIEEMSKQIWITKLDATGSENDSTTEPVESYIVIPNGDITFKGNSEDNLNVYTINLIIVKKQQLSGQNLLGSITAGAKALKILSKKAVGVVRYGTKGLGI